MITYPGRSPISCDHNDGGYRAVLGEETGSVTAVLLLENFSSSHICIGTYLVVSTTIAPAFCSRLALTAAIAQVSDVGTGTGARRLSSSY